MSFHVYALYSSSLDRIYIGQTQDLDRRLAEHAKEYSSYTSRASDWCLIYSEGYETRLESMQRERQLKSSWGRRFLRLKLNK